MQILKARKDTRLCEMQQKFNVIITDMLKLLTCPYELSGTYIPIRRGG